MRICKMLIYCVKLDHALYSINYGMYLYGHITFDPRYMHMYICIVRTQCIASSVAHRVYFRGCFAAAPFPPP